LLLLPLVIDHVVAGCRKCSSRDPGGNQDPTSLPLHLRLKIPVHGARVMDFSVDCAHIFVSTRDSTNYGWFFLKRMLNPFLIRCRSVENLVIGSSASCGGALPPSGHPRPAQLAALQLAQVRIPGRLRLRASLCSAMVLTASLDKTARLLSGTTCVCIVALPSFSPNRYSQNTLQTVYFNHPAWSCEWNASDPSYFFIGNSIGNPSSGSCVELSGVE